LLRRSVAPKIRAVASETLRLLWFSVACAAGATALILPPALAVGFLLARREFRGRTLVETLIALPLVLPPVATGLVLLHLFGRYGPVGGALHRLGLDVAFTPAAVLLAMGVMAFPLLARGARVAFEGVDPRLEGIARTLGASERRVLWTITLPLARRGLVAAGLLAFARALGEFGATILVAGDVPGRTTTLSVGIWRSIQAGEDRAALALAAISALLGFGAVAASELLLARERRRR
jgi:molybdate transport system permease protein